MKKVIFVLLAMSLPMCAQTTYSSSTPFICDMASVYPITSFNQFSCRGITYHDTTNTLEIEYFFRGSPNWFDLYMANGGVLRPPVLGEEYITQLTAFTPSANGQPGTYAFNWTLTDTNNVVHTGTVSGTWQDIRICGGRGCLWHAPQLLSNKITINN